MLLVLIFINTLAKIRERILTLYAGTYNKLKIYEVTTSVTEVEELDYMRKSKAANWTGPRTLSRLKGQYAYLDQQYTSGNVSIWLAHGGTSRVTYYGIDNTSHRAQIQLVCTDSNGVLKDLSLYAAPNNTIKAADFYHILITKLNKVLVATHQSPGSQTVWAKLNTFPDVAIHGWLNGKPVNITPDDREYAYATEPQSRQSQELRDAHKMKLVAHKK